ncbi:Pyruvate kinase 1 [Nymphaea thermarum]|nr:Pyruvate kinase 1 [Nymphaea thermarum]
MEPLSWLKDRSKLSRLVSRFNQVGMGPDKEEKHYASSVSKTRSTNFPCVGSGYEAFVTMILEPPAPSFADVVSQLQGHQTMRLLHVNEGVDQSVVFTTQQAGGVDAIILGAKILCGLYPVETISIVDKICDEAEKVFNQDLYFKKTVNYDGEPMSHLESIARSRLPSFICFTSYRRAARANYGPLISAIPVYPSKLSRYCMKWYIIVLKRIDARWWNAVMAPLKELESGATDGITRLKALKFAIGTNTWVLQCLKNIKKQVSRVAWCFGDTEAPCLTSSISSPSS